MIGVSAAFFISRYGSHFTIDNILDGMNWLGKNNFGSLQLEIFHYEQLGEWTFPNCMRMKEAFKKENFRVSQFVAHFLMNSFESFESLINNSGIDELEFLSVILNHFSITDTITIPVPPFSGDVNDREILHFFDLKLKKIEQIGKKYNLKIALEPQPDSLAADLSYLNRFSFIHLNLDPGHLLCSGINPFNLDLEILSRVVATHLCENDGVENLSLKPGSFSYNWSSLIRNLIGAGYSNSLDLEIICPPDHVEREYTEGNIFLNN
ncbi:MAG: hypothetical protein PF518_11665 [Spirochaetaceae bacterium]|nr:hypothetical protein [Spirochaetaceae bacterium]